MKVIEVPVFNDDGSIKLTQLISPEEAKTLLQFAINFLTAAGMAGTYMLQDTEDDEEDAETPRNYS